MSSLRLTKKTLSIFKFTGILLCCFIASGLSAQDQNTGKPDSPNKFPEAEAFSNSVITYKIINSANKTFCYDIFSDGRLLIHQPSVPGMPGNEGFKTSQSAEKVAKLVIAKIKKGEMPPSVSKEEMRKLKAIK